MELKPGEVICDQCNGTGKPNNNRVKFGEIYIVVPNFCDKCNGSGKLDWVENIVGKKKQLEFNPNISFGMFNPGLIVTGA